MAELEALSIEERRAKSALLLMAPGVTDLVGDYRRKYTADGATVPPHFTLMFPFLAPSEITPEVRARIGDVAAAVPAFDFTLSRVDRFPGSVLFLAPDSPEPFIDLIERFRSAFPEISPYWDMHDRIVPHLTVADEALVDSPELLDDIERAVSAHLPIHGEAREVVLLQRVRPSPAPWDVRGRFPLAPTSARGSTPIDLNSERVKTCTANNHLSNYPAHPLPAVRLAPFTASWLPHIQPWFADTEVQRWLGGPDWPGIVLRLVEQFTPGKSYRGAFVLSRFAFVGLDAANDPATLVDCEVYDRETRYAGHDADGPLFEDASSVHQPEMGISIVTNPSRQREGFGMATIRALLDRPDIARCPVIKAGIEPENDASRRLLERAGFSLESTEPDWEGMLTYRLEQSPS